MSDKEDNPGCILPLIFFAMLVSFFTLFLIPKMHDDFMGVIREHEAFELGFGEYFVNKDGNKEFRWKAKP